MEERERGSFHKAKMETVAEAVLCSEKEPPVADTDPGFTEALEGLCAFSSPNQFSSSPEVGMWRQENGSIYRQRESPSSCLEATKAKVMLDTQDPEIKRQIAFQYCHPHQLNCLIRKIP